MIVYLLHSDLTSVFSYLSFVALGVEYDSSTIILPGSDEGISDAIFIPSSIGFPFDDSLQTEFYVSIYLKELVCSHFILNSIIGWNKWYHFIWRFLWFLL